MPQFPAWLQQDQHGLDVLLAAYSLDSPHSPACAPLPRRRMPFLKKVLDLPAFKAVINKVAPAGGGLPV